MTVRLSIRSFAGMARTDVAVGTVSDASMLCTTRAPTPRIGSTLAAAGVATSLTGCATGSAGVGAEVTRGCETVGWEVKVVAAGVATAGGGVATGVEGTAGAGVATGVATGIAGGVGDDAAACRACAFGCGGTPPRGPCGDDGFAALPLGVMEVAAEGAKFDALNSGELKNSRQFDSTELGSATYFSYISSTSQSLAPKFPLTEGKPIGGLACPLLRHDVTTVNGRTLWLLGILEVMASVTPSTSSGASHSSQSAKPWAIVTGGSRGLGFESAKGLVARGFRVVLVAKDEQRLKSACDAINAQFAQSGEPVATYHAIDFEASTPQALAEVRASAQVILDRYQPIWGLPKVVIIAHGVMSAKMSKTLRTDVDEWRRVMSINLDSVFTLINLFGAVMSEARDGRIIIYSACLGRMSGPGNAGGLAPYRISKAGVNALVRNLAHETGQGSRGFLVDAVCPNHSRTDMGGEDAPRSAEEGAACSIWLATREFTTGVDQTGLLWEDNEVVPW